MLMLAGYTHTLLNVSLAGADHPVPSEQPSTPDGDEFRRLHLACNQYPWYTFYRREDRTWGDDLDAVLGEVAQSGCAGYEPAVTSPLEIDQLVPLLQKHGLQMRSLYVNSTLHIPDEIERSIEQVLAIAEAAQPIETRIIVTNPSPIRWGGAESKTDAQLEGQAAALDRLGRELRERGLTLGYHTHDVEMRHAAREFHHMLLATDPDHVTLCLDPHWIYRGAGDSQVALFDLVRLYGRRITEVHLRQSNGGVWTEAFGPGDIDYPRLANELRQLDVRPHVVLEQAVEDGTPHTVDAVAAHREGLSYAAQVFGGLAA